MTPGKKKQDFTTVRTTFTVITIISVVPFFVFRIPFSYFAHAGAAGTGIPPRTGHCGTPSV
jgi:hypothetical protein